MKRVWMEHIGSRLSGGTLMYVLLLMVLVSGVLMAAIWAFGLGKHAQARLFHQTIARDNLLSAMSYFRYEIQEGSYVGDLYGEEADPVWMNATPWGLWEVVTIKTRHARAIDSTAAFVGNFLRNDHALYLEDLGQPLMISGQTQLVGKLRLSPQGIRPTRVDGQSFAGGQLYRGTIDRSFKNLPRLDLTSLDLLKEQLSVLLLNRPGNLQQSIRDSMKASWFAPMEILQVPGSLLIESGAEIRGKILLIAREEIEVEAGAELSDIILMAPSIRIASGFRGSLQAVAVAEIEIDSLVSLEYPSSLVLLPQTNQPSLRIGKESEVEGTVLMLAGESEGKPIRGGAYVGEGTTITGWSYLDGTLDLRGRHIGELSVHAFSYDGRSRQYRNTLNGAQISRAPLSDGFVGPRREGESGPIEVITWLD